MDGLMGVQDFRVFWISSKLPSTILEVETVKREIQLCAAALATDHKHFVIEANDQLRVY